MAKRRERRPAFTTASDIQAAVDAAGYDWTAQEPPAKARGLGLRADRAELAALRATVERENEVVSFGSAFTAPSSVDWRTGNWVTSVKDQESCGSCVAFGSCATIESRIKIVCNDSSRETDLSEAHLFFCGCGRCCATGWNFVPALERCREHGVGLEKDFLYTPNNQPCKNIESFVKITSWRRVYSTAERKSVIASKGPVLAGMAVFSDFFGYSSGVYRRVSDDLQGYHAVCVVGYDDARQCWIVKNSWGDDWGEGGYVNIAYGDSELLIDSTYPFYDVDLTCPSRKEDDCRRYVPFLQRVLSVARYDRRLRACLRYYVCRRGGRPYCGQREIQIVRYVLLVLRKCPQYRAPFCRILG